jgi:hypothetical protein
MAGKAPQKVSVQQLWRTAAVVSDELNSCLYEVEEEYAVKEDTGVEASEMGSKSLVLFHVFFFFVFVFFFVDNNDQLGKISTMEEFYSFYTALETQALAHSYGENEASKKNEKRKRTKKKKKKKS